MPHPARSDNVTARRTTHGSNNTEPPAARRSRGQNPAKKVTARTIGIRQKQDAAVRLRSEGLTLQEIADTLGFADRAGASRAIRTALQRTESEAVDEWRHLLDAQLDAGVKVAFDVLNGVPAAQIVIPDGMDEREGEDWLDRIAARLAADHESRLKAVDRLVRIVERRAKLHGVDAPVKTEVSGDGSFTLLFSPALKPASTQGGTE